MTAKLIESLPAELVAVAVRAYEPATAPVVNVSTPEVEPTVNRLALVPLIVQVGAGLPVAAKVVRVVAPAGTLDEMLLPLLVVMTGMVCAAVTVTVRTIDAEPAEFVDVAVTA